MKTAILTIGPRGAGKSTWCDGVLKVHPEVVLVSRDKILISMYGSTERNPYSSDHYFATQRMWEVVAEKLNSANQITMILDCWNGWASERRDLSAKLREFGADAVIGWHFTTDLATCLQWFTRREVKDSDPDWVRQMRFATCRHDYELYHNQPVTIDQGFDRIHQIDPHQMTPCLLGL